MKRKNKPVALDDSTIIDVRSYEGFKNHLVLNRNYNASNEAGREALCGYTNWLMREPLTINSPWIVSSDATHITTEHFCSGCVEEFNRI